MAAKLELLLDVLRVSIDTFSPEEIKDSCKLIIEVQGMTGAERDCIRASFKDGPLFDGDIPSKSARDSLVNNGYMVKVVVRGEDGYNGCTNKGAWAYRLIEAGA